MEELVWCYFFRKLETFGHLRWENEKYWGRNLVTEYGTETARSWMDIWGSARKSREELCWRSLVSFQLMWIGRGLQKVARWWNVCQYMMLRLVCDVLRMPVALLGLCFFFLWDHINSYRCVQFWHDFYTGEPTSFPEQDGGIVHVTTPDNTHRSRQTSVPPTEFEPAAWASGYWDRPLWRMMKYETYTTVNRRTEN